MDLESFINNSIKDNYPFVSYRLPGRTLPITLTSSKIEKFGNQKEYPVNQGFIIQPFVVCQKFPTVFFHHENEFEGWEVAMGQKARSVGFQSYGKDESCFAGQNRMEYLKEVDKLILSCQKGELEKVVFSRTIEIEIPANLSLGRLYGQLCNEYSGAFVYVFNIGNRQTWLGATPETLLKSLSGKCETMSLAGTVANNPEPKATNFEFSNKELQEQKMVTEYIVKTLNFNNVQNLTKHKLEVRNAGPVTHLLNRFSFDLPLGESPIKLALKLHPTPAVCGLPPNKALELIQDNEPHNRAYYSGFLGPVTNKTTANLFVNLRSMVVVDQKAFIFAGGGITSGSNPADEWEETNLKAQTLLRIIEQQT